MEVEVIEKVREGDAIIRIAFHGSLETLQRLPHAAKFAEAVARQILRDRA